MGSDGRTPHTLKGTGEEVEKVMEKLAALEYTRKGRQQGAGKLRIGTNMKLSFKKHQLFRTSCANNFVKTASYYLIHVTFAATFAVQSGENTINCNIKKVDQKYLIKSNP